MYHHHKFRSFGIVRNARSRCVNEPLARTLHGRANNRILSPNGEKGDMMPTIEKEKPRPARYGSGASSNPRNNLDPWARLASHVLVNAGREYRSVVNALDKKRQTKNDRRALEARRESIRAEILDPLNIWTRYLNRDGEEMMFSIDRDIAKGKRK